MEKIEQGTSAWHNFRRLGVGGSDIPSVIGISPWKTVHQLWLEKTGQVEPEDLSNNYAVQRGVQNEPKARAELELITGLEFPPVLAVHPEYDFMRVSLDGQNDDTLCEIKVPGKKTFDDAKNGVVADHYMAQIQYQLMVSGCKKAIYFCFNPEQGKHALINVAPDATYQDKIKAAVIKFWGQVKSNEAPELTDKDYKDVEGLEFSTLADAWKVLTSQLKPIEAQLKMVELKLKDYTKDHAAIRGCGIRILRSSRKGAVDYDKIPQLKCIDLEAYRKAPVTVRSITLLK